MLRCSPYSFGAGTLLTHEPRNGQAARFAILQGTHMVGRPAEGNLYLIFSQPPEKIERYYLRWAFAHVTIFLVALAGFAWLRQFWLAAP